MANSLNATSQLVVALTPRRLCNTHERSSSYGDVAHVRELHVLRAWMTQQTQKNWRDEQHSPNLELLHFFCHKDNVEGSSHSKVYSVPCDCRWGLQQVRNSLEKEVRKTDTVGPKRCENPHMTMRQ